MLFLVCVLVVGAWHGVWMGVGCPCPPIRNDIATPRHLFFLVLHKRKVCRRTQRALKAPSKGLFLFTNFFPCHSSGYIVHVVIKKNPEGGKDSSLLILFLERPHPVHPPSLPCYPVYVIFSRHVFQSNHRHIFLFMPLPFEVVRRL